MRTSELPALRVEPRGCGQTMIRSPKRRILQYGAPFWVNQVIVQSAARARHLSRRFAR